MTLSFFGHADFSKEDWHEGAIWEILEKTVGNGPADIFFGGYGGFDHFAFSCCKRYKASHPEICLLFVTPYIPTHYQSAVLRQSEYDGTIYPEIEGKPPRFAIYYRNRWMVERSDFIVFYVSHNWGGANTAYQYAQKRKRALCNLADLEKRNAEIQ